MASVSAETPASHGHSFSKKTFHKPTYCHGCTDMLWGLIQQGYICEVCNFVVHDRCLKAVVSPCSSIAASLIKNPVAHCWSEQVHHRRKFCNVCRKRLDDSLSIHCEICEYFVHTECQDFAVADCKENATYLPGKDLAQVKHTHHWREGNLPSSSKCAVCKKNCFSAECLSGFRCEWCGMTLHSYCHKNIPQECTFGNLEPIYLPPHAVSIPRTEVPMEAIIGVQVRRKEVLAHNIGEQFDFAESEQIGAAGRLAEVLRRLSLVLPRSCHGNCHASPPYVRARSISEEFSSADTRYRDNGEPGPGGTHGRDPRSPKEKEDKDRGDEEMIKVYDGNNSLRRRIFRVISVPRQATTEQVLTSALRAFHITKDPSNFYLTDLYATDETELCDPTPVLNLNRKEGKRPAVFLRFKDSEAGEVRVYPGKLQVSESFCIVPVTETSTVADLIEEALQKFGLENFKSEDYRCSEILLDRGVTERVLTREEKPWDIVKQLGKDSIRQMELMRFYLQLKQDPHGPNLALFVGNLPPNLSERSYENMLTEFLGKENKFSSIGPIYYEYGSMVIIYEDANKAVRALYTLRESKYEDKHLLVMLLPSIEPSMVPPGVQPLLVFVNVKSGGCQGLQLISSFRKLLNPYQVFDLDNGGPLPGLYVFRHIKDYKILVCGGDGTIGWVLQCLDNVGQDSECSSPACAIVPLGTGNDLARVLCWGPGYTGVEDPLTLLRDVIDAEESHLDRWTVVFHPEEKEDKQMTPNTGGVGATSEDNTQIFVMNNYFGIGLDADLCLDFHNAREENPDKFKSRLHNKRKYVTMGLRKMVKRTPCKDLHKEIRLEVDGRLVELPQVEGIIILNILSWGSGANPWGSDTKEDQFYTPNHWDGMLEVVGVTGVMHLGQIQSGIRGGMRIAQGGHIKIHLQSDTPVQVDGEPWVQSPGDIVVLKSALKATMLKKTKGKMKRRNTESSMQLALQAAPSSEPEPEIF
ncbi:diacylglycerol kinase theta isoform X4 [Hylaeus anthracinus]|uniref:diacylglycerol kinase theta isoform X4 n=1 Tax=Hylaeus volcanicus TaxID=313075 RepID=UPI0023B86993|nr:diacylglycerol kinase theta isoform X4 [Hylaeus volcanicus]XP_054003165.1 diacylglycerol kinase theta isoform X4 [Hylaeus anthracinus]